MVGMEHLDLAHLQEELGIDPDRLDMDLEDLGMDLDRLDTDIGMDPEDPGMDQEHLGMDLHLHMDKKKAEREGEGSGGGGRGHLALQQSHLIEGVCVMTWPRQQQHPWLPFPSLGRGGGRVRGVVRSGSCGRGGAWCGCEQVQRITIHKFQFK